MTTVAQDARTEPKRRPWWLEATEMWASLAITSMWLAVVFCSVFGPDIRSGSGVGDIGEHTAVPSGVVVAFFAAVASWLVARNAFRRER